MKELKPYHNPIMDHHIMHDFVADIWMCYDIYIAWHSMTHAHLWVVFHKNYDDRHVYAVLIKVYLAHRSYLNL